MSMPMSMSMSMPTLSMPTDKENEEFQEFMTFEKNVFNYISMKETDNLKSYIMNNTKFISRGRWSDPCRSMLVYSIYNNDDKYTTFIIKEILPLFGENFIDTHFYNLYIKMFLKFDHIESMKLFYENGKVCSFYKKELLKKNEFAKYSKEINELDTYKCKYPCQCD